MKTYGKEIVSLAFTSAVVKPVNAAQSAIAIVPAIIPTAEPKPPIRLITALPSERSEGGVKSGISATTGARHKDIENTNKITVIIVSGSAKSPVVFNATNGISANNTAETGAQVTINGRRLPNFE